MSTLQSLNTWLTFNKLSTHREASVYFLTYISTGLTLQYIAKKRVTSVLIKFDLSKDEIINLHQTTDNDVNNTQNNKRKPDGQLKKQQKVNNASYFLLLSCVRRESNSAIVPTKSLPSPIKSSVIPVTPPC